MGKIRNILLVDDNKQTSRLNKALLVEMQIADEVITLTCPWVALQYIVEVLHRKDLPEESAPDLAFLDIKMSGMDGFQFLMDLEAFRIDIEKLRIVVLSDDLDLESKVKLANFGSRISAYLSQPLHKKTVEDVLQKLNI